MSEWIILLLVPFAVIAVIACVAAVITLVTRSKRQWSMQQMQSPPQQAAGTARRSAPSTAPAGAVDSSD